MVCWVGPEQSTDPPDFVAMHTHAFPQKNSSYAFLLSRLPEVQRGINQVCVGVYVRQCLPTQRGELSLNGYIPLNKFLIFTNPSAIFLAPMGRFLKILNEFLLLLIFISF